MRIAVLGGGPGGLYFSALAKQLDPRHEITVWERNAPDDTFGFGVVFSDETLGGIEHADTAIFGAMEREFARWDDIDVHYRGTVITSGGHGFAAMSRHRLLAILQERCARLGVRTRFRAQAPDLARLAATHDLVVAADGANSQTRAALASTFVPSLEARRCKYIWLGTDLVFDAFKFYVLDTPWGIMQVHGYPYSRDASTFILELHDDVWRRAGFAARTPGPLPPGRSDEASIELIGDLCAEVLGEHRITGNNSQWVNFTTVRCATWRQGNIVLLGDAAHTAHFSIGSGTKLAMEDALALAACLHEQPGMPAALAAYEAERQPVVASTQRAAQASLEWFENIGHYTDQDPPQFAFNIITRSRRVTYDTQRLRDPEFVAAMDCWFAGEYGSGDGPHTSQLPSASGSSMPSHISRVEPFRPEWPSWMPLRAPVAECTKPTIRRQAASCAGVYSPAQPGVMRPGSDTHTISVITSPAPPSALLPRCTRWKSPGTPSRALYMSIGETMTRLASSSGPILPGWNIGGHTCGAAGGGPSWPAWLTWPGRLTWFPANQPSSPATNSGSRIRRLS